MDDLSGFTAVFQAIIVIGFAVVLIGGCSVAAIMVWARRTGKTRLWLILPLALVAVFCGEASLTVTGVALNSGSTPDGRALIFGVISGLAVLCLVKQHPRHSGPPDTTSS